MPPLTPSSMDIALGLVRLAALASQFWVARAVRNALRARGVRRSGAWAAPVLAAGLALTLYGGLFDIGYLIGASGREPNAWRFLSAVWVFGCCCALAIDIVWRATATLAGRGRPEAPRPAPSAAATTTRRALIAAPFAVSGYGVFIGRRRFELREVETAIRDLPADLEGLRIAQVTDIHAGPFLSRSDLDYVVGMVNDTRPHLAVVTGDLITGPGDPIEEAIDALAAIRADAGIYGCMGNHEEFAGCRRLAEERGRQRGIRFLREAREPLRFGSADLVVTGIDYRRLGTPYLDGSVGYARPGATNLLLSHNPDVFPAAAEAGYDLVLAGHTHGGQITVEIVEQTVNAGRFFTPFVSGAYRIGDSSLYVSRGVGTVSLPMRVGALPEVTLVRLRRA